MNDVTLQTMVRGGESLPEIDVDGSALLGGAEGRPSSGPHRRLSGRRLSRRDSSTPYPTSKLVTLPPLKKQESSGLGIGFGTLSIEDAGPVSSRTRGRLAGASSFVAPDELEDKQPMQVDARVQHAPPALEHRRSGRLEQLRDDLEEHSRRATGIIEHHGRRFALHGQQERAEGAAC